MEPRINYMKVAPGVYDDRGQLEATQRCLAEVTPRALSATRSAVISW
jgi:hypothetical protein